MRLKKILKLLGLVVMILLVCLGIGIIGGAPIPPMRKRENDTEQVTEQPETDESGTLHLKEQE